MERSGVRKNRELTPQKARLTLETTCFLFSWLRNITNKIVSLVIFYLSPTFELVAFILT